MEGIKKERWLGTGFYFCLKFFFSTRPLGKFSFKDFGRYLGLRTAKLQGFFPKIMLRL